VAGFDRGIAYAAKQVQELIDAGVPGIHFFTSSTRSQQSKRPARCWRGGETPRGGPDMTDPLPPGSINALADLDRPRTLRPHAQSRGRVRSGEDRIEIDGRTARHFRASNDSTSAWQAMRDSAA